MRIINRRHAAIVLVASPFVVLGWFFASWLAHQTARVSERPEIVIVDPPKEFNKTAARLGFIVVQKDDNSEIEFKSYRVRIPKGFEVESAKNYLRQHVPGLILANLHTAAPNPGE